MQHSVLYNELKKLLRHRNFNDRLDKKKFEKIFIMKILQFYL